MPINFSPFLLKLEPWGAKLIGSVIDSQVYTYERQSQQHSKWTYCIRMPLSHFSISVEAGATRRLNSSPS